MWVRSQDKKTLVYSECFREGDNCIIVTTGEVYAMVIGKYETVKRALEVLDEIQNFIACDGEMNDCKFKVYQMPEK